MMLCMKIVLVLCYFVFEDFGFFEFWLCVQGFEVCYYEVGVDDFDVVDVEGVDLFIVFGGLISVVDEVNYFWLVDEVVLLWCCFDIQWVLFGICFGV